MKARATGASADLSTTIAWPKRLTPVTWVPRPTQVTREAQETEAGLGHPERVIDFDYRAVHETAEQAKAVIRAFYGEAPKRSYFSSCSKGGRQGLMEAQRCATPARKPGFARGPELFGPDRCREILFPPPISD